MTSNSERNHDASDDRMETDPVDDGGIDSDDEGGLRINREIYIPPPPKKRDELDANAPRLMIDKIVNVNFKSYAGTVTIGFFDEYFSAIIGPNGSGKSNVIDSMLFVFGYRATKIRLKKISELIHNSPEHTNIRSCSVAIHFKRIIDKGNGVCEAVPDDPGAVISRTAFKDSSSFYELNGRKVQLKEIAKFLRSEGIDIDHNRFLILQGEVEQIAMMKPKKPNEHETGMLEFLEDIIGTTRYKEPLEKLSQNVDILTECRVEKLNRLRILEADKAALMEPMQQAIDYMTLENSITKLQHKLYHCKRYAAETEITEKRAKKEEMDEDLAKLVSEIQKVREEHETMDAEVKEKCKKWSALQQKKDQATAKFDDIRKRDEALHAELVETNKRRKANIESLKKEKASLEELVKVPEKNEKDIKECEDLVEKSTVSCEKEEAKLKELMEGLREKTEPLLKDRSELERKLIDLRKNVNEAKATLDIAESELDIYTSVEQTEKKKLEDLRESLRTTSESYQQRRQQLTTLDGKIPRTKKSLEEAQRDLGSVKSEEAAETAKLHNLRVQLTETRSAMSASKSRNRVIEALMEEKRAGRLPGVFGRLGDLGAIDAKYDVAVSTACGPLDNVVVDTLETANACVLYLRRNDVGRATFIPLEKQAKFIPQCQQKITTPENVPRLFDLIKVEDKRVLPAFYYALRNTLVANDLDQATRIAYGAQRYRVVSLKGELIELSGTMSGGGRTAARGRMGQSVVRGEPTAAEVENLQSSLDLTYEKCNRLRQRQQPLEEQIESLSTSLKEMLVDRDRCAIEIKTLKVQEESLRSQVPKQEEKAAAAVSSPGQVKKLTKAVEGARANYDKVKERSKDTEGAVERLSQEIERISGDRVKEQQKKISSLNKGIDKAQAEIRRLRVAIKTAERNTKKSEQRIETLTNDVKTCEQRLRDVQGEKVKFEEDAKIILKTIDELSEELTERDELSGAYKEKMQALASRESKMKAVKIDLDQKMRDAKKSLEEAEAAVAEYSRRIRSLGLHAIPTQQPETLEEIANEELEEIDAKSVSAQLQRKKQELPTEIPNMNIIKEYQLQEATYLKRAAELDEITAERNKLRDIYDMARRRRCEEFLAGFVSITSKLKQMYQMITLDGDAELELVDSMDPFSEGIVFSVRPPKKSWKNICNLSGGEKTLSSLALVFALHHYKPSPVYFMDEIDAALDFKNISIIGNYIKDRAKDSQFIIISLRDNMFGLANKLVGIYKTDNATKTVTIDMEPYRPKEPIISESQPALRNRFYSQAVGPTTENPAAKDRRPAGRPVQEVPSTCPAGISNMELPATTSEHDLSFGLGDISITETPSKTPTRRSSSGSDIDATPTKRKPPRKRRKN